MFITEFNTKILEAFVEERKVSFLLMVMYPVRNVCTNYTLKTVQNKFVKETSFQKNWSMNVMSVRWNCPHDSRSHDGTFCFRETGVKVTFKTLLCPYDHRKIVQVDFTDKNRILDMVNDRTEVFFE